jgi:hypothetical protein
MKGEKMAEIKYPWQIASVKRNKKVLGVDAQLAIPDEASDVSPLEMHAGYSRFVLTLVDTEHNISPTANIPAGEVAYIKKMTDLAMLKSMVSPKSSKEESEELNTAYTQKLFDKKFKGMTPAEVLIKNPADKTLLVQTRDWLEANVSRYPNNKLQIEAIDNALLLLDMDELKKTDIKSIDSVTTIYKSGNKFKSKTNANGLNLIYSITITYNPAMNYPYAVEITNCYAPVETLGNGQKNIKMQQAVDKVESSLLMNDIEWFSVIDRMELTLENFESMNFSSCYQRALKAFELNLNKSKNK